MIDGPDVYEDDLASVAIATGDLFFPVAEFGKVDGAGVVLTPMCDLVQEKIDRVKLALAIPFRTYLAEELIPEILKVDNEYRGEIDKDPIAFGRSYLSDSSRRVDVKTLRLVREMQRVIKNVSPRRPSQYYLPGKSDPAQGFLVDFSFILSIPCDNLKERTTLLRLKSPWREQLLNRYVNFSSRVGTLDYSSESVCKAIKAFYPELTVEQILSKMKQ